MKSLIYGLVPEPIRRPLYEFVDKVRLSREPKRPVDYSDLAPLGSIDLDDVLTPGELEAEWQAEEAEIHRDVLKAAEVQYGCNPGDRRVLYHFVRRQKPRAILEIGTLFGVSTVFMAAALKRNMAEDPTYSPELHTVDIADVNDETDKRWQRFGLPASPRRMVEAVGMEQHVTFHVGDSAQFLAAPPRRFDFVFHDGTTASAGFYRDLQNLPNALAPDAAILVHVYLPEGKPLWLNEPPIRGPWRAITRLQREGVPIGARPLGDLPWPTKAGTNRTSIGLIGRTS